MSRLVLVAAALVGLVALAACDGGEDDDVVADGPGTTEPAKPSAPGADDGAGGPLHLDVEAPDVLVQGEPVTWRLTLANTGEDPVTISFSTSQRGEVVLTGDAGEVYRWSAERVFAQVLGEETVRAGEELTFTLEEPSLEVPPGTYRLTATITGRPAPPPAERTVEVQAG